MVFFPSNYFGTVPSHIFDLGDEAEDIITFIRWNLFVRQGGGFIFFSKYPVDTCGVSFLGLR